MYIINKLTLMLVAKLHLYFAGEISGPIEQNPANSLAQICFEINHIEIIMIQYGEKPETLLKYSN